MKRIVIVCALSALCVNAQENRTRPYSATSGFGNILYPGTGGPPVSRQTTRPIFAPQQPGIRNAAPLVSSRPRVLILPSYFAMPYYGFAPSYNFGYGYEQPQPAQQQQVPYQQAPAVIINQNFAPEAPRPYMREYPSGSLREPSRPEPERRAESKSADDDKPTVYLIAMKDSTIYSSLAYWVEDDTVHYITTQHSHNRASIDLVDRDLSIQLNRERGIEFKLPGR